MNTIATYSTTTNRPFCTAPASRASTVILASRCEPLVRVLPLGTLPETRWVRGTLFCDIGLAVDERLGRLIILSAIDNLCRGASGQAVANANLMLGLDETAGLPLAPLRP